MEKRANLGWSALNIIGIVYTIIGLVFLTLAAVFAFLDEDPDFWVLSLVFGLLGGVFAVLGVVFLAVQWGKKKQADRIIASGRFVWGQVVDCQINYNVRVGNRSPVIFVVKFVDGAGVSHIFRSHGVKAYRDPAFIGKPVRVYVGDDSFRHYYVDVDGILPNVVEHG